MKMYNLSRRSEHTFRLGSRLMGFTEEYVENHLKTHSFKEYVSSIDGKMVEPRPPILCSCGGGFPVVGEVMVVENFYYLVVVE